MTPILSVKHLDAGYDNKSVVSDIHFDALKGQMIGLLGPKIFLLCLPTAFLFHL